MGRATTISPIPPATLVDAARRGDPAAFTQLVDPHRNELHVHAYRMLGSLHDADDALQDALLRAWRGLHSFDGGRPLRPWLYRITTNVSLDMLRRRKARILPRSCLTASRRRGLPKRICSSSIPPDVCTTRKT